MKSSPFKTGDQLVCVELDSACILEVGNIYIVDKIYWPEYDGIDDDDDKYQDPSVHVKGITFYCFRLSRFKLLPHVPTEDLTTVKEMFKV